MRFVVCVVVASVAAGCPPPDLVCSPRDEGELERLAGFGDTQCDVDVVGTDLSTLDGLRGLRSADSITIGDNAQLTSVQVGLSEVTAVPFLSMFSNPRVTELRLLQGGLGGLSTSGNELASIELVVDDRASVQLTNEPVSLLSIQGQTLNSLSLFTVTQLSDLSGIDVTSIFALQIHDAPVLLQGDVDAFVGGLDPPPSSVIVCGTVDGDPC